MPNGKISKELYEKQLYEEQLKEQHSEVNSGLVEQVENIGTICDNILGIIENLTEKLSPILKPDKLNINPDINNDSLCDLRNTILSIQFKLSGLNRRIDL